MYKFEIKKYFIERFCIFKYWSISLNTRFIINLIAKFIGIDTAFADLIIRK